MIETPINLRAQQQRFELGGEEHPAVRQEGIIERLLAEAVTSEEQRLLPGIPQCKGKLPVEAIETRRAPLLPGVDDDLGVAAGAEHVAQPCQLGHQRLEVIDLAVIDDTDRLILVEQRLVTGGQIDDRQAAVAEPQPRCQMEAVAVRSAMPEDIGHMAQQAPIDPPMSPMIEDSRYAAHLLSVRLIIATISPVIIA